MASDIGEPQIVIGKMCSDAASRRGMPPMLNIAFAKLMGGGAEQVIPSEGRFCMHERHHILELIAKSVGPAGLIKTGAPPNPAAQRLIQEPTVGHDVDGGIGSIDIH